MAGQKIRIRLKAYDHEVIDTSAKKSALSSASAFLASTKALR